MISSSKIFSFLRNFRVCKSICFLKVYIYKSIDCLRIIKFWKLFLSSTLFCKDFHKRIKQLFSVNFHFAWQSFKLFSIFDSQFFHLLSFLCSTRNCFLLNLISVLRLLTNHFTRLKFVFYSLQFLFCNCQQINLHCLQLFIKLLYFLSQAVMFFFH